MVGITNIEREYRRKVSKAALAKVEKAKRRAARRRNAKILATPAEHAAKKVNTVIVPGTKKAEPFKVNKFKPKKRPDPSMRKLTADEIMEANQNMAILINADAIRGDKRAMLAVRALVKKAGMVIEDG